MKTSIVLFLLAFMTGIAGANIMTSEIDYKQGSTVFKGYVAYDDAIKGKRPGVLVVHEWWGLNDFIKGKTRALAAMGYVAFAPDMYGEGRTATDPREAAKMAGEVRGTPLLRERVVLGLNTLRTMANVDSAHVAAIGFCFGGTAVLELAYSGAEVNGVVTFHASIVSPKPEDVSSIKTKLLVLHGANDPFTPADSIRQFQEMMRKSKADWQMIYFGNAVHGFTNPSNGTDASKGLAFDAIAAERSWRYMLDFFENIGLNKQPVEKTVRGAGMGKK